MVMKRYPNGIRGEFFFMKRAPTSRPSWVPICSIAHHSGNVIDFPVVQDTATLLWIVNLGCIDLNPWYTRCDDVDRPDYLHFDLDPTPGATFDLVRQTALVVRSALAEMKIDCYAKTTGSRGIHVYVPIVRGPTQKQVWTFAKALSVELAKRNPALITAEYKVAKRPRRRVLVDYNQNAWNRTLASVYSVRPRPSAAVSTPVSWQEVEAGIQIDDFTINTVPPRLAKIGDLWQPVLASRGRTDLSQFL
jgi:bifunctional non-homologous end joining protein LigD